MGASDKELDLLTDKFINENVNQVVVVDDIFYNKSNYFPDQTFINNDQLDDLRVIILNISMMMIKNGLN